MAGAIATASNMIPSAPILSVYRSMSSYGNTDPPATMITTSHMHTHNGLNATLTTTTSTNNNTTTTNNNNLPVNFNLDDLVWAKIMGFPWWPCRLIKDEFNSFYRKSSRLL
jgi:hypothetical protein